ncbi:hypothetical protein Tco_1347221 [Tanacetum coccineum]
MTSPTRGGGPEGQDGREGTPPLTKEQIEGHISAMKSIIKDHNKRNKANPIRLNFEIEDQDPNEDRIVKGKEIDDEDLSKPFKETLKTPFTRRIIEFSGPEYSMPTNIALYNGSTDPADHLNRFVGAANSRGMAHAGIVPNVSADIGRISRGKYPNLANLFCIIAQRWSNEMMKRLDEFVRAEEAYALAELPPGESTRIPSSIVHF